LLAAAEYKNVPEQTYDFTKAKVIKVYDGDTYWIAAWHCGRLLRFRIRLYGVDCAEMKSKDLEQKQQAINAKQYVSDLILGQIVDIDVLENRMINGKVIKEKWGRLLCTIKTHGVDIAQLLIDQKYAKPYFGGTKHDE
jgi:endonuclease YncB( thermonuclease family)